VCLEAFEELHRLIAAVVLNMAALASCSACLWVHVLISWRFV